MGIQTLDHEIDLFRLRLNLHRYYVSSPKQPFPGLQKRRSDPDYTSDVEID